MIDKRMGWIIESIAPVDTPDNQTAVKESTGTLGEKSGGREWDVIIIKAGSGSSGDYSQEVLERDVPTAFPVGTKVYIDHPKESDEWERPERSVRDIAGTITSEAVWDEAEGGMRSRVRIIDQWAPFVEQVADSIGLSIRAQAIVSPEVNESGRYDIMGIVPWPTNSVDIVTVPGAGGRFMEAYESVRATMKNNHDKKEASVDLTDIQKVVTEAIAPLLEAHKEPEAPTAPEHVDTVKMIVESDLPSALKIRVAEAVDANPGASVADLIATMSEIAEAVRAEVEGQKEPEDKIEESGVHKHGREPIDLDITSLKF